MATLLQQIGTILGLGNSELLVSGTTVTQGTTNAAFHFDVQQSEATGEQLLVAAAGGASINAETDRRALMLGSQGNDVLTGGDHADLIVGGSGTNALTGGSGTDVFGHAAGAVDVVTDFSASAGERIALQSGLSLTSSSTGTVNPADFGLAGASAQGVTLTFDDGSQVILLNNSETPESGWFL